VWRRRNQAFLGPRDLNLAIDHLEILGPGPGPPLVDRGFEDSVCLAARGFS
jgi:hypothetical protein